MEQKYPKAMANFKTWIDRYKSEHDWDTLFNADFIKFTKEQKKGEDLVQNIISSVIPKYHELPIAMQFGIFMEYQYYIGPVIGYYVTTELKTGNEVGPSNLNDWCKDHIHMFFKFVEDRL